MEPRLPLLPKWHPLDVKVCVRDGVDETDGWAAVWVAAGCLKAGWCVAPRVGVVAVQLGTPCVMDPLKRLPAVADPFPTAGVGEDSRLAASTFCCRLSVCRLWITDDEGGCNGCCG